MAFSNGVGGYFLPGWAGLGTAQAQADAVAAVMRGGYTTGIDSPDGQGQFTNHFLPQQNVIGFDTLWEDLADILKDGTCRSFIAKLIGTAQEQTGKKAHAFTVEEMLAELKNNPADGSKDGIYLFETGGKELIGYGGWNKATGKGWVEISDIINIGGDIRGGHRALARMFLHEIIHTATKFATAIQATGGYSDVELASAIFEITKDWRDDPDDPRNKSPRGYQTTTGGVIFNRALQKYCK